MNKQNLIVLSLSVVLFLTISFIVYSWSEPTTAMPTEYNPPINTSSEGQTKSGWLKINSPITTPMIYDGDDCDSEGQNCSYYINPSGDSVVSGTISSSATPIQSNHITTKGYVDGLFGGIVQEESLSNVSYVVGDNLSCSDYIPDSIELMKSWISKTCTAYHSICSGYSNSCTTPGLFQSSGLPAPTCSDYVICGNSYQSFSCTADSWNAVLCAKMDNVLYNNKHTEQQCRIWGGEMVTVEGDKKICKFNMPSCQGDWLQHENWSTTVANSANQHQGPVYTGSHDWSNTPRESFYCFYDSYGLCDLNYNYGLKGGYVYATVTEIGCY